MPFENSEIIFEKYVYNVKEKSIHKLFYLEADSEDEASPMIKASVINPAFIKLHFTSFMQRLSNLEFPIYKKLARNSSDEQTTSLRREQFFDTENFDVVVLMVRIIIFHKITGNWRSIEKRFYGLKTIQINN
jgi:hypothetical protein